MSEKLDRSALTMICNLEEKTGRSLAQWVELARANGHARHRDMLNFLKSEHGLTYGYANLVTLTALDQGIASTASEDDLVEAQYAGEKSALRPIYESLIAAVTDFGQDVALAPKKAYVSLRRNKQFAIFQPTTRTRLDVGINLKGVEPAGRLEASGSFNSMVSHRVRLERPDQVDDELIGWLRVGYDAA